MTFDRDGIAPITPVAYMAHPVSGPTQLDILANLDRAKRWLAWLLLIYPTYSIIAPWIPYLEVMDDSPRNRARGLRDQCANIARCDVLFLVGGELTRGMAQEKKHARVNHVTIMDLLYVGKEPPTFQAEDAPPAVLAGWQDDDDLHDQGGDD